jgi:glycosyltransferase involved in cell wall biosynthesis
MGRAATELARTRYDWEAVVDEYEKLFEDLLRG